jgi:hypothetical protein
MNVPRRGNPVRWPVGVVAISDDIPQYRSVVSTRAFPVQLGAEAICHPPKGAP